MYFEFRNRTRLIRTPHLYGSYGPFSVSINGVSLYRNSFLLLHKEGPFVQVLLWNGIN